MPLLVVQGSAAMAAGESWHVKEVTETGALPAPTDDLYLDVVLNGISTHLIANFKQRPNGRLASTRDELRQIGVKVADAGPDGIVELDAVPGLVYGIDSATQTVMIDAGDEALLPHDFDLRAGAELPPVESSTGAVVNYTLFATSSADFGFGSEDAAGSAQIDARFFSPYGTLLQSGIAGGGMQQDGSLLRLDTAWTYSDSKSLRSYRAGDLITGALSWTRAVRLGGVQFRRNFGLRPDLVTMPVPAFAGSAAVPSSLEVYANNVRVFSEDVAPGPFSISNLPVVTGNGDARLVISDSLGRRTETSLPFYASSELLRRGLSDFSFELGFPRALYGVESNEYSGMLAGSASIRHGLSDRLTLEGHAEANADVMNAGAGLVFPLKQYGLASISASGSAGEGIGGQLSASLQLGFGGLQFNMRAAGTAGDYADVASTVDTRFFHGGNLDLLRPPKAVAQATLSLPLGFDASRVSLNYTDIVTADHDRSQTIGLSWDRQVFGRAWLHANGFVELGDDDRNYGLYAGLSIPIGDRISTEASVSSDSGRVSAGVEAVRSETPEPGSIGWRIRDREGETPDRLAAVSYTGSKARVRAGIEQFDEKTIATGEVDGALVMAGGGAFLSRRIDDAFVIVDAGAPNVAVLHENRPVGVTNARGKLLVTGLNGYQKNALAIDPNSLPVDAEMDRTAAIVVPAERSGVTARFGVREAPASALVVFRDPSGAPIPVGASGHLNGGSEQFVVGYDGEAFLSGLKTKNAVEITLAEGATCVATFPYRPERGRQVRMDDVRCAPTASKATASIH